MNLKSAAELTDRELLARVEDLVRDERCATVALVVHLGEIGKRKLYLEQGCRSLFVYCTRVLHFSEHAAYNRIMAARAAQRFPAVLAALESGDVHLTAVKILARVLTPENHRELLAAAKHKSKDEIEELVVRLKPQPDVRAGVRKLPGAKAAKAPGSVRATATANGETATGCAGRETELQFGNAAGPDGRAATAPLPPAGAAAPTPPVETAVNLSPAGAAAATMPPPATAAILPLAPERYKVQFTANAATRDKLRRAQELLRHRIPDGDLAAVMDLALDLLVHDLEKRKFAATNRLRRNTAPAHPAVSAADDPDSGAGNHAAGANGDGITRTAPPAATAASRYIPAAVRRAVWQRDQGCCAFVGANGVRCAERGQLEFDHIRPYGDGGSTTVENLRLLCRSHNQHAAQQFFGLWQAESDREPVPQRE